MIVSLTLFLTLFKSRYTLAYVHMSSLTNNFLLRLLQIGLILGLLAGCEAEAVATPTRVAPTATLPLGVSLATRTQATAVFSQSTATPLPTSTPAPTATPILHVIQEGDTLLDIAIVNNVTVADITNLNPDVNPNLLTVGQQLLLPTPEGAAETLDELGETAVVESLEIIQVQLYPLPQGSGWLLGELQNAGETAVEDVRLTLRLRDGAGEAVWETAVWLPVPLLPAGESAPFGALVRELPSDVQPDLIIAGGREVVASGSRLSSFVVTDLRLDGETVRGTVQHVGEGAATRVTLLLALYDASGRLVGFRQQGITDHLAAGEEQPFVVPIAPPGGTAVRVEALTWGTAVGESE